MGVAAECLGLIVGRPGRLDVRGLAEVLARTESPPAARPHRSEAEYQAWRAARREHARRRAVAVSRMHRLVGAALRNLCRRGLILPADTARIDRDAARLMGVSGAAGLRDVVEVVDGDGEHVGWRDGAEHCGHGVAILHVLASRPDGVGMGELRALTDGLTPAGHERGAWRRAWVRLADDGLVHTAAMRWPTLAGILEVRRVDGEPGADDTQAAIAAHRRAG